MVTRESVIDGLAQGLYEMFLTEEKAARWDGLEESDRRIWRVRAEAVASVCYGGLKTIIDEMMVAALQAERETLAADQAPGWPAVCAIIVKLRALAEVTKLGDRPAPGGS
jgi:hypothetical protein